MIERYSVPEIKKIWSLENKFRRYLDVEIAVLESLEELKIIPKVSDKIKKKARINIKRIKEIEEKTKHDVIAFVQSIEEITGKEGRFFHYGLTSSDVIDTANALMLRETLTKILSLLKGLNESILKRAEENKYLISVGRTHGIHAEPITMGLKFLSWFSEMKRCEKRLEDTIEKISYGKISGAVGTYSQIPPEVEKLTLYKLGLKIEPVSTQVIPRDRYCEFMFSLVMIGEGIERIVTEIRNLQRTEIGELQEPFEEGQRGSSAMPHKKNPVLCERLCGMSRVLRGYLLSILENNALWNERDISHSSVERIVIPDASELTAYMIKTLKYIIDGIVINRENIKKNLELLSGLIFSSLVLNKLVEKGLMRKNAYGIVQRNAFKSEGTDGFLKNLLNDKEVRRYLSEDEIKGIFKFEHYLKNIDYIFEKVKNEI
uniref:Adenylosuccinate lyase n=1 Tax=candidate division WOR-3 bacterium TaxID=2052148 RepID=A0A7C4UBW6_UNCW3